MGNLFDAVRRPHCTGTSTFCRLKGFGKQETAGTRLVLWSGEAGVQALATVRIYEQVPPTMVLLSGAITAPLTTMYGWNFLSSVTDAHGLYAFLNYQQLESAVFYLSMTAIA